VHKVQLHETESNDGQRVETDGWSARFALTAEQLVHVVKYQKPQRHHDPVVDCFANAWNNVSIFQCGIAERIQCDNGYIHNEQKCKGGNKPVEVQVCNNFGISHKFDDEPDHDADIQG